MQARLEQLTGKIGISLRSDWISIDQTMIDGFADMTGDHQPIHVDIDAARKSGFDATIAHGFLTLSLLSRLWNDVNDALLPPDVTSLNYGFDRLRFLRPVPAGARIRGHFRLLRAEGSPPDRIRATLDAQVEMEAEGLPIVAVAAQWIILLILPRRE